MAREYTEQGREVEVRVDAVRERAASISDADLSRVSEQERRDAQLVQVEIIASSLWQPGHCN